MSIHSGKHCSGLTTALAGADAHETQHVIHTPHYAAVSTDSPQGSPPGRQHASSLTKPWPCSHAPAQPAAHHTSAQHARCGCWSCTGGTFPQSNPTKTPCTAACTSKMHQYIQLLVSLLGCISHGGRWHTTIVAQMTYRMSNGISCHMGCRLPEHQYLQLPFAACSRLPCSTHLLEEPCEGLDEGCQERHIFGV